MRALRYPAALIWWLMWLFRGRKTVRGVQTWVCMTSDAFDTQWPHDYKLHRGGDGYPDHFHTFTCPRCGREFTI